MKKKKLLVLSLTSFALFACGNTGETSATTSSVASSSVSSNSENDSSSQTSSSVEPLKATTLYMIGDSTCANYDLATKNTTYYYQIQGFGTTIKDYFKKEVTVKNLGVGGASTKSFPTEDKSKENYAEFKNNVKAGDYAIITFGHNDEKKTAVGTQLGTIADTITSDTFQGYLYSNYIKVCLDAGATPILATPIARYDSKGNWEEGTKYLHVMTEDSTFNAGDYAQAIRDVAEKYSLTCIDTTKMTGDALRALGAEEGKKWYGWPTSTSYDGTHVNIYGAQQVGYMMAKTLKESTNNLGKYVVDDLKAPTEAEYLKQNPSYVEPTYIAPGEGTWSSHWNTTNNWHGSVFGGMKKSSFAKELDKYSITENGGTSADGTLSVTLADTDPNYSGRLNSTADGMVMYFQQINKNDSFTLEASVKIDNLTSDAVRQQQNAVGIMVRDDMYIDQYISGLTSRYAAAGYYGTAFDEAGSYTYCAWARRYDDTNTTEGKKDRIKESYYPKENSTIDVKIVKNDTSVQTYYKLATDSQYQEGQSFDTDLELTAVDSDYVYAGLFLCGGAGMTATFTNVKLTINPVE